MAYITARKRAEGLGPAHNGTHHAWSMIISSISLLILIPLFIAVVVPAIGAEYSTVASYFARPYPAVITGLTISVGMYHFKEGAHVMITDYSTGSWRAVLIIINACLSYAIIAIALFALVRLQNSSGIHI